MALIRRKPKRFIAVNINHGRFQVIIPWAVYLNEKYEGDYPTWKPIPHEIVKEHPELRLDCIMGRSSAIATARWLNKHYPYGD